MSALHRRQQQPLQQQRRGPQQQQRQQRRTVVRAVAQQQQQQQQQELVSGSATAAHVAIASVAADLGVAGREVGELFAALGFQAETRQEELLQRLEFADVRALLAAAPRAIAAAPAPVGVAGAGARRAGVRALVRAAPRHFEAFAVDDFRCLLRAGAAARFAPDARWLSALLFADAHGVERFYRSPALPPRLHVALIADVATLLAAGGGAFLISEARAAAAAAAAGDEQAAAELAALQEEVEAAAAALESVEQDPVLPVELSALGGLWLLRRLLPGIARDDAAAAPLAVLAAATALPGLGYRVLDADDAELLTQTLAQQAPRWSPPELAAALTAALPSLGNVAPRVGTALGALFQAAGEGAASGRLAPDDAARTLMALNLVPGFAPDARVAQALLDAALEPPLSFSPKAMHGLLAAAEDMGAAPRPEQLGDIAALLGKKEGRQQ